MPASNNWALDSRAPGDYQNAAPIAGMHYRHTLPNSHLLPACVSNYDNKYENYIVLESEPTIESPDCSYSAHHSAHHSYPAGQFDHMQFTHQPNRPNHHCHVNHINHMSRSNHFCPQNGCSNHLKQPNDSYLLVRLRQFQKSSASKQMFQLAPQ